MWCENKLCAKLKKGAALNKEDIFVDTTRYAMFGANNKNRALVRAGCLILI